MATYLLSTTVPLSNLLAFATGLAELARTWPDESTMILPEGIEEIDALEAQIQVLSDAEMKFFTEQREEADAWAAKDQALTEAKTWYASVRERAALLFRRETTAIVLKKVILDDFAVVSKLREDDVSKRAFALSEATLAYVELFKKTGMDESFLKEGKAKAQKLALALQALDVEKVQRSSAIGMRNVARTALVKQLQRLDDYLGVGLPQEGRLSLQALRVHHLPLLKADQTEEEEDNIEKDTPVADAETPKV